MNKLPRSVFVNLKLLFQTAEEKKRRRESALRQHSFFQLRLHLRRGRNLVARDKTGLFLSKLFKILYLFFLFYNLHLIYLKIYKQILNKHGA